jgi:hypothetical protein
LGGLGLFFLQYGQDEERGAAAYIAFTVTAEARGKAQAWSCVDVPAAADSCLAGIQCPPAIREPGGDVRPLLHVRAPLRRATAGGCEE